MAGWELYNAHVMSTSGFDRQIVDTIIRLKFFFFSLLSAIIVLYLFEARARTSPVSCRVFVCVFFSTFLV